MKTYLATDTTPQLTEITLNTDLSGPVRAYYVVTDEDQGSEYELTLTYGGDYDGVSEETLNLPFTTEVGGKYYYSCTWKFLTKVSDSSSGCEVSVSQLASTTGHAQALAMDDAKEYLYVGTMWAADSGKVMKLKISTGEWVNDSIWPVDIGQSFAALAYNDGKLYASVEDVYPNKPRIVDVVTGSVTEVSYDNLFGVSNQGYGNNKYYLHKPRGIAVDPAGEYLYIGDYYQSRLIRIKISSGESSVFAGEKIGCWQNCYEQTGYDKYLNTSLDHPETELGNYQNFDKCYSPVIVGEYLYFGSKHSVWKVKLSDTVNPGESDEVTPVVGEAAGAYTNQHPRVGTDPAWTTFECPDLSGNFWWDKYYPCNGDTGATSTFYDIYSLVVDETGDYFYLSENRGHRIRKVEIATGKTTTLVGLGGDTSTNGPASTADFSWPGQMVADYENDCLYVTDVSGVRKIELNPCSDSGDGDDYILIETTAIDNFFFYFGEIGSGGVTIDWNVNPDPAGYVLTDTIFPDTPYQTTTSEGTGIVDIQPDGSGTIYKQWETPHPRTIKITGDVRKFWDMWEWEIIVDSLAKVTSMTISGMSTITDAAGLFEYLENLVSLDVSNFDTSNVTTTSRMFAYMGSNLDLDLSSWDVSKVTDMNEMFSQCHANTINVSNFDTSSVTDMSWMFRGCTSPNLDLSSFDTSKVTNMKHMFEYSEVGELNVSNWDTGLVENMYLMFAWSRDLSTITGGIENWDTSNVTNMGGMFNGATSLTNLNLSNWCVSLIATGGTLNTDGNFGFAGLAHIPANIPPFAQTPSNLPIWGTCP